MVLALVDVAPTPLSYQTFHRESKILQLVLGIDPPTFRVASHAAAFAEYRPDDIILEHVYDPQVWATVYRHWVFGLPLTHSFCPDLLQCINVVGGVSLSSLLSALKSTASNVSWSIRTTSEVLTSSFIRECTHLTCHLFEALDHKSLG